MDAREIMTKDVIAVAPDMLVAEAVDLLLRNRIHGAPVVDDAGQLMGMISFMDLAGRHGVRVSEIMAPDPVSASVDTPVEEVAAMMIDETGGGCRSSRAGAWWASSAPATSSKCSSIFTKSPAAPPRGSASPPSAGAVKDNRPMSEVRAHGAGSGQEGKCNRNHERVRHEADWRGRDDAEADPRSRSQRRDRQDDG